MTKVNFSKLKLPFEKGHWVDADERIFQACFTILGEFVENELGTEPFSYQTEESMYRGYRVHFEGPAHPQAIDLWIWYKDELPLLEEEVNKDIKLSARPMTFGQPDEYGLTPVIFGPPAQEPKYVYGHVDRVKNKKLAELMSIRNSLWT